MLSFYAMKAETWPVNVIDVQAEKVLRWALTTLGVRRIARKNILEKVSGVISILTSQK